MILENPDGSSIRVSLSEVAYAPQGKCNLFSGGMFAQKAKLTGIYNDQYMTWINDKGHKIGHAIFDNGLYHLKVGTASNPFESGEVVAATVNFDEPVWKWHRRLGHLGFQNMLKLLDSSTGMEITAAQIRAKLKAVCPVMCCYTGTGQDSAGPSQAPRARARTDGACRCLGTIPHRGFRRHQVFSPHYR